MPSQPTGEPAGPPHRSPTLPMTPIIWTDPVRQQRFAAWLLSLQASHGVQAETARAAEVDAHISTDADTGMHRYLRVDSQRGGGFIVLDAPPDTPAWRTVIETSNSVADGDLKLPGVLVANDADGFALLEDLGSPSFLQALLQASTPEVDRLMRAATQALIQWQLKVDASRLPAFDESLQRRELQLFDQWCVQTEFARQWSAQELAWWEHSCKVLAANFAAQPQLAVHRNFVPRSLVLCEGGTGVLDFQDARRGPISYDLASLLRGAHISWDEERELDWAIRYWEQARRAGLPVGEDFGELWRQIEWAGLQRHLMTLGLLCRLKQREGMPVEEREIARHFAYATKVATRYIELSPLVRLLESLQGSLVQTGFTLR